MATRKKSSGRQAVRNNKGSFPGWGYLLIGLAAGAIAMLVISHRGGIKSSGPQAHPDATAERSSDAGVAQASSQPKKPQYDFYSVLPEKEVRIPDAEVSAMARAEQKRQQADAPTPTVGTVATVPATPSHVPTNAPSAISENVTAAPASAVSPGHGAGGYLLQVGAFPNAADAESLKAKLALQGFVASVQAVKVSGQTYHRVRLGPFSSATALQSTQQRLSGAGIHAIALKEGN